MKGLIIKGIGGFYYVKSAVGIIECKGRGSFRNEGVKLAVGDYCEVTETDLSPEAKKRGILHEGVIESIFPRRNQFIRPPIVNVDMFLITFACTKPEPGFALIDKFLIMAEMNNVDAVLVMNKCDLLDDGELNKISSIYKNVYPVIEVSTVSGFGIDKINNVISGRTVCFAGPSGVGKSSIINCLIPHANMETGVLSSKTERGKHTTRHVEIFETESGGLVYDTPGFTSFEIMEAEEDNLEDFYPEIALYKGQCFYDNCRHIKEPDCAVRNAVRDGKINKMRYLSYKANIEEIRNKRRY